MGIGPRQWLQEPGGPAVSPLALPGSLLVQAPALLYAVGAAVAGGVGDSGIHGNIAQPHTGHLGIVHSLDEHSLQALQHLQHLCPLHWPARLMGPVLLGVTKVAGRGVMC